MVGWLMVGRLMVGRTMVGQLMVGRWLVNGWSMVGRWLVDGWLIKFGEIWLKLVKLSQFSQTRASLYLTAFSRILQEPPFTLTPFPG